MDAELVWLHDERTFASVLRRDAYTSMVRYVREGITFEVMVDNDDYDYITEFNEGEESGDED